MSPLLRLLRNTSLPQAAVRWLIHAGLLWVETRSGNGSWERADLHP